MTNLSLSLSLALSLSVCHPFLRISKQRSIRAPFSSLRESDGVCVVDILIVDHAGLFSLAPVDDYYLELQSNLVAHLSLFFQSTTT
jgi:hypothetical protein